MPVRHSNVYAGGDAKRRRLRGRAVRSPFQRLLDWAPKAAGKEGDLRHRLREHFGADPSEFPRRRSFPEYDRPNVQLGLDAYLAAPGRSADVVGFTGAFMHLEPSFALLVSPGPYAMSAEPGPVGRTVVELDEGRSLAYVTTGLFLVKDGDSRLAVLVASQRYASQRCFVEVMAPEQETGEAFLAELRGSWPSTTSTAGRSISLSAPRARRDEHQRRLPSAQARRRATRSCCRRASSSGWSAAPSSSTGTPRPCAIADTTCVAGSCSTDRRGRARR